MRSSKGTRRRPPLPQGYLHNTIYVKEPRVVYNLQTRLRNKNNQSLSELICTSRYRVAHKAPLWVNLFIKSTIWCFLHSKVYMRTASARVVLTSCLSSPSRYVGCVIDKSAKCLHSIPCPSSCQWVVELADMIIMIMLRDNVTRIMRNIQQLFIGHAHTPIFMHSFMSRPGSPLLHLVAVAADPLCQAVRRRAKTSRNDNKLCRLHITITLLAIANC